jgi:transcription initiation factor IIE alpha subunit
MDPTILLAVLAAVAVLAGGFLLVRRLGRRGVDATFHHFQCPGCRRRLRFQGRQVGHKGRCSHCGRDLVFPAVSQSID